MKARAGNRCRTESRRRMTVILPRTCSHRGTTRAILGPRALRPMSWCLRSPFYLVERAAGGVLSRTGLAWAPGVERAGRASPPLHRPPSTPAAALRPLSFSLSPPGLRSFLSLERSTEAYLSLPPPSTATSRDISGPRGRALGPGRTYRTRQRGSAPAAERTDGEAPARARRGTRRGAMKTGPLLKLS